MVVVVGMRNRSCGQYQSDKWLGCDFYKNEIKLIWNRGESETLLFN